MKYCINTLFCLICCTEILRKELSYFLSKSLYVYAKKKDFMFDFPLSTAAETKTQNIHCFLQTCQNNLHSVEKLTFQKEFKANKDK